MTSSLRLDLFVSGILHLVAKTGKVSATVKDEASFSTDFTLQRLTWPPMYPEMALLTPATRCMHASQHQKQPAPKKTTLSPSSLPSPIVGVSVSRWIGLVLESIDPSHHLLPLWARWPWQHGSYWLIVA